MAKNTNSQIFFSFSEKWIFGHNLGFSNSVWRSSTVASGTSTLILKLVWTGATMDGAIFNSQTRRSSVTFVILEMDNLRNFELRLLFEFSHKAKNAQNQKLTIFRFKLRYLLWFFNFLTYFTLCQKVENCYDFTTFDLLNVTSNSWKIMTNIVIWRKINWQLLIFDLIFRQMKAIWRIWLFSHGNSWHFYVKKVKNHNKYYILTENSKLLILIKIVKWKRSIFAIWRVFCFNSKSWKIIVGKIINFTLKMLGFEWETKTKIVLWRKL